VSSLLPALACAQQVLAVRQSPAAVLGPVHSRAQLLLPLLPRSGGYKTVSNNGALKWPDGKRGLCGDTPGGRQQFAQPGQVVGE
jgi:hypothetical protein